MSTRKNKIGAFLTGALFGGLVGAAIALLYAPQSGEETRTVIKEKGVELKEKAVESGTEIRHKAEATATQARHRIEEAAGATRERAADLQHRGMAYLDEQRARIKSAIEAGKTAPAPIAAEAAEKTVDSPN